MAATPKQAKAMMRLQYYRSSISTPEKHKRVVKGLGFTRLNQVVEREDTASDPWHGQDRAAPGADRQVRPPEGT
jgi:large subunit ribosomal protein L30